MLKINVDAETKNIKPSGNSKLGEDGRRWDTVFCHHIDCNALSIMSTILPIPQATLGLENNRWEALYTKVVSAENVQADSLQSREVSTENIINSSTLTANQIQCNSLQCNSLGVSGSLSVQSLQVNQNLSASATNTNSLTASSISATSISVNNLNASSSLSSSNINTTNINVSYEAHIYSCIVHYYFRSPHIVFPNGWSIAPSGNGLAFYDSSGYAVLIVRNDGIWFNGQKII